MIAAISLLAAGCDNTIVGSSGPVGADLVSYLRPMTKVRVYMTASTLVRYGVIQSSFDPGASNDIWSERLYRFENYDTSYSIDWQDSEFSMKSCYRILNLTTGGGSEDTYCSDRSLIRGTCGSASGGVSDLTCFVSVLAGSSSSQSPDPDNYRMSYLSIRVPKLSLEAIHDDSVSFVMNDPNLWRSVGLSYSDSERWDGSYSKNVTLLQFDTLGIQTTPQCRVVFYNPK
ncbi:MAG: hypothetical protein JSS75_03595 [Bacteroidetes bacterium]|nr:hypothetical protein [Bacteroidota bacterium]